MNRARKSILIFALIVPFGAMTARSATLVGVTGDGAGTPESLFILDQNDASATFLMQLGNGDDGETIAFNPADALLYHASGIVDGDRYWETIDVTSATIVTSNQFVGPFTGQGVDSENLAIAYNVATGTFLVSNRETDANGDSFTQFYDTTLAGVATDIGSTPEDLKGLAFVGSVLYGASVASNLLYTLDPSDGSVISSVTVTLDDNLIAGMNGLALNFETGELWGIFRQADGVRSLGVLDPSTGEATSVGVLDDNYAGIAFVTMAAVPEPGSLTLWGLGALGWAAAVRRRRNKWLSLQTRGRASP